MNRVTRAPSCVARAQEVTGREVHQAELVTQPHGLRALAGAGRADQDQVPVHPEQPRTPTGR